MFSCLPSVPWRVFVGRQHNSVLYLLSEINTADRADTTGPTTSASKAGLLLKCLKMSHNLARTFINSSKNPHYSRSYRKHYSSSQISDCLLQLWEQTQAENTKLRLELSGVKSENETLKHQLGSAAQQVSQINAMTDAEKREKQIVLKKLAEMEEELKVRGLLISNKHQLSIYQSERNLSLQYLNLKSHN